MTSEGGEEKAASKAERQQARLERQARRADKQSKTGSHEGEKSVRLCLLETIEVKKTAEGFQIFLSSSEGRRSFAIPKADAAAMLRDIEAAIPLMRAYL